MNAIICFAGFFLAALALWTNKYFGPVTIDQVVSIVVFNHRALIDANHFFSMSFITWCLLLPAVVTLLSYKKLKKYGNLLVLLISIYLFTYQFNLINFITHSFNHTDFYQKNYVDPAQINISAHDPKSLLLIYVESLETTYSNTNLFGKDLLRRLNHLSINHISFSQYEQMPGTDWSIAGVVATQCAVPLKVSAKLKAKFFGDDVNHVIASAGCLGDILAAAGYRNIYMNGSRLSFAGFGPFFKDHHYAELYGREKWLRSGILHKDQMTEWGLPDDMLLMIAKLRLSQLVQDKHPFNLTLFLIDTHGISGQLSPTCAQAGYADFPGIVECTANQVADLVYYVQKQGWLDRMNIIIMGDHLAMKNVVSDKLATAKKRYIFNMIISKNKLYKNNEQIVAFDMLPTILTSLGFEYSGGRLGLGYSAIGSDNTYRPENRLKVLAENLLYQSDIYNHLWRKPSSRGHEEVAASR